MARRSLRAHSIEREEADEERVGPCGAAGDTPVNENTLGVFGDAQGLDAGESAAHVVVGLVPVLLEIDERTGDPDEFLLGRFAVRSGNELWGARRSANCLVTVFIVA